MKKILTFIITITFLLAPSITMATTLENPIVYLQGKQPLEGIPLIFNQIINFSLGFIGSFALLMFIYGGLLWLTSAGKQEKIDKGKNTITWAAIGFVIILASYAIVNFIISALLAPTPKP